MDIALPSTHPKTGCALQITMFLANNAWSPAVDTKFWTAENQASKQSATIRQPEQVVFASKQSKGDEAHF